MKNIAYLVFLLAFGYGYPVEDSYEHFGDRNDYYGQTHYTPDYGHEQSNHHHPDDGSYNHGYGGGYAPNYNHDHYAYPKYKFEYGVHDPHTGDIKKQFEERDGDVVRGYYSMVEADGSIRIVEYYADKTGFHATVHKIGESRHPPHHHNHHGSGHHGYGGHYGGGNNFGGNFESNPNDNSQEYDYGQVPPSQSDFSSGEGVYGPAYNYDNDATKFDFLPQHNYAFQDISNYDDDRDDKNDYYKRSPSNVAPYNIAKVERKKKSEKKESTTTKKPTTMKTNEKIQPNDKAVVKVEETTTSKNQQKPATSFTTEKVVPSNKAK